MSARIVITKRSQPVRALCSVTELDLEKVCPSCMEEHPHIHDICGQCLPCCDCQTCRKCHSIMHLSGCGACGLCRACCKCWACRNCNAPHTHKDMLCTRCGYGISGRGCGCCQHGRRGGTYVEHFRNQVNLDRYKAKTPAHHTLNPSDRLVAAEMEICGIARKPDLVSTAVASWHGSIVSDGSLPEGGFEINTHPASGDFFLAQINDICQALKLSGASVTHKAGCHIHVDASDLGYVGMARLLRLAACVEPALFAMIPYTRRFSRYCQFWAPRYLAHIHQADAKVTDETNKRKIIVAYRKSVCNPLYGRVNRDTIKAARSHKGASQRYRALNVHSWFHRGTVEFRMPPGTIYADNVINWGLLLSNLVDLAAFRSHEEILAITKPLETKIKERSWYSHEILDIPQEFKDDSIKLLKSLAPSPAVRDWITERIKWADKFRTESAFNESYI